MEHSMNDSSLLKEFSRSGDEKVFELLMKRYGPMVFNTCMRILTQAHDSEDASQAVFIILAKKAAKLKKRDSIGGWLHRTASNVSLKLREKRIRRAEREKEAGNMREQKKEGVENWDVLAPVLDRELDVLPEKFRNPVIEFHLEGKSVKEIARIRNVPEGTVTSWLSRGRELLKVRLAQKGVILAAGSLAALLSANAHIYSMPAGFAASTATAASAVAVKGLTAGILSAEVFAIVKGVLIMTKIKIAACVLGIVILAGGMAGITAVQLAETGRTVKKAPVLKGALKSKKDAQPETKKIVHNPLKNGPLTFTLKSDRNVLLGAKTNPPGATSPLKIELAKLSYEFINNSNNDIRFNTYDLGWRKIKLEVTGPDPKSVKILKVLVERMMAAPVAENFPLLKPKAAWKTTFPTQFPENFGPELIVLMKPGIYRVSATYLNKKERGNFEHDLSKKCWVGKIKSNTIELKVIEAGAVTDGLQLGLEIQPHTWSSPGKVNFNCWVRNVSGRTIRIKDWSLYTDGLQISRNDGRRVNYRGAARGMRRIMLSDFPELQPDEKKLFRSTGSLFESPDNPAFPHEFNLFVKASSGVSRTWNLDSFNCTIQAFLKNDRDKNWGLHFKDGSAKLDEFWVGAAASNSVLIMDEK